MSEFLRDVVNRARREKELRDSAETQKTDEEMVRLLTTQDGRSTADIKRLGQLTQTFLKAPQSPRTRKQRLIRAQRIVTGKS